jgi:hypothetical protein
MRPGYSAGARSESRNAGLRFPPGSSGSGKTRHLPAPCGKRNESAALENLMCARLLPLRQRILPLPKGGGRGEGEGDVIRHGRVMTFECYRGRVGVTTAQRRRRFSLALKPSRPKPCRAAACHRTPCPVSLRSLSTALAAAHGTMLNFIDHGEFQRCGKRKTGTVQPPMPAPGPWAVDSNLPHPAGVLPTPMKL